MKISVFFSLNIVLPDLCVHACPYSKIDFTKTETRHAEPSRPSWPLSPEKCQQKDAKMQINLTIGVTLKLIKSYF